MAKAEVAGRHFKRLSGEDIAWPGTGKARQLNRVNSSTLVNGVFGASDKRIHWGGGWVIAAGDVDFDVAEPALREMRFQCSSGFGGFHIGHEAQVHFCDGAAGENGLSTGAGVAADKALDVDGRTRNEELQGFFEADVVNPVLDAHSFFHSVFVQALSGLCDHFSFRVAERTGFVSETVNRGIVAVGRDERV